jgi:hypothetical protein
MGAIGGGSGRETQPVTGHLPIPRVDVPASGIEIPFVSVGVPRLGDSYGSSCAATLH